MKIVICVRSDEVFPIRVTGYDEFRSVADGPGYLSNLEALPSDTNLLLFVPYRFFPTHLFVIDDASGVQVYLYGKCAPLYSWNDAYGDSATDCTLDQVGRSRGIVPVALEHGPPAGRPLIDGNRSQPVDRIADRG